MPSNERRAFLATVSALSAGFAGCLGNTSPGKSGDPPSSDESTTSPETTKTTSTTETSPENSSFSLPDSSVKAVGDARVAVANPTVEKAVTYESIMGSGGVLDSEGNQFVVAEVQSQSGKQADAKGDPKYDAFELVADGETYSAVTIEDRTVGAYTISLAGRGDIRYDDPYATAANVGWVAFEPPSPLDATEAAIRCRYGGDAAEWTLSDDAVANLSRPAPTFELRSFDATVDGSTVELSFVAKNVSKNDGRFLAALYWPTTGIADDDESTIIDRPVGAGGEFGWAKEFDAEYTSGEVTVRIDGAVTDEITVDAGK